MKNLFISYSSVCHRLVLHGCYDDAIWRSYGSHVYITAVLFPDSSSFLYIFFSLIPPTLSLSFILYIVACSLVYILFDHPLSIHILIQPSHRHIVLSSNQCALQVLDRSLSHRSMSYTTTYFLPSETTVNLSVLSATSLISQTSTLQPVLISYTHCYPRTTHSRNRLSSVQRIPDRG